MVEAGVTEGDAVVVVVALESLDCSLAVCWLLLQEANENRSAPRNTVERNRSGIMVVVFNDEEMQDGRSDAGGKDS